MMHSRSRSSGKPQPSRCQPSLQCMETNTDGQCNGEGLFEQLEHEIHMYTMKDGESMEANLNCNGLKYRLSMTQMMVRKQRMKLDLRPSILNVKGASLSFLQSVHH